MKQYDSCCLIQDKVRDAGASRQKLHFLVSESVPSPLGTLEWQYQNTHSSAQHQNIYVNLLYFNFGTSSNTASGLTKENTLRWRKSQTVVRLAWTLSLNQWMMTNVSASECDHSRDRVTNFSFLDIKNRTAPESSTSCSKKLKNLE